MEKNKVIEDIIRKHFNINYKGPPRVLAAIKAALEEAYQAGVNECKADIDKKG